MASNPPPPPLPLPQILTHTSTPPRLVTQGAEALLYQTTYLLPTIPCALKYRPKKPYRHPILDARLTKARILAEARVLTKCRREGVVVPAVYALDERLGWLMMEWVEGEVVKVQLRAWIEGKALDGEYFETEEEEALKGLMRRIGKAVGALHAVGIVHGDLTTSNLMLRPREGEDGELDGDIVLIDFGLASTATQEEDRAVDLYVLERAFGSTHPRTEGHFREVLSAYGDSFKGAKGVLKRLEEVRMRGRKRSMLG